MKERSILFIMLQAFALNSNHSIQLEAISVLPDGIYFCRILGEYKNCHPQINDRKVVQKDQRLSFTEDLHQCEGGYF